MPRIKNFPSATRFFEDHPRIGIAGWYLAGAIVISIIAAAPFILRHFDTKAGRAEARQIASQYHTLTITDYKWYLFQGRIEAHTKEGPTISIPSQNEFANKLVEPFIDRYSNIKVPIEVEIVYTDEPAQRDKESYPHYRDNGSYLRFTIVNSLPSKPID
jgi:hypothetical protein